MDVASYYQRIAGISLAFAAGLLHRAEHPAPHIHLPQAVCPREVEVEAEFTASGSWGALVGVFTVAYFLGVFFPPERLVRYLIRFYLRGRSPSATTTSAEPSAELRADAGAHSRRVPPVFNEA